MKMKISDILRKTMAKIIGAVIAMHIDGISEEEAVELEYPHTLETLQSEMDVDYTQTNADVIRSMSDEELADMLHNIGSYVNDGEPLIDIWIGEKETTLDDSFGDVLDWLQSEVEE